MVVIMKTFHWRKIGTSPHLQMLLEILKSAPGPLTGMEVQQAFQQRGKWAVNPGTDIGELGRNPGYVTSGGVHFPDRKYRYWLIAAPGWTPSWIVTKDFRVVRIGSQTPQDEPMEVLQDQAEGGKTEGSNLQPSDFSPVPPAAPDLIAPCPMPVSAFFDRLKGTK